MASLLGELSAAAARRFGRRLGLLLAAGFFALTGIGFATAAIFLALAGSIGTIGAAAVVAALYGFAAVAVLLSVRRNTPAPPSEDEVSDTEAVARLIAAFMAGFRAGNGGGRGL